MATLRRILKYTPVVVMGLLVVAWVVSRWRTIWYPISVPGLRDYLVFVVCDSSIAVTFERNPNPLEGPYVWPYIFGGPNHPLGALEKNCMPIPLLINTWLPLAIGPFISFRFRLWHYLAYTALVAVELAYYLRWHL
jgi:hypothetical protein